jgi:hypothetical protein
MTQIFSNWLLRRKIDAHVRQSGQAMEHRRVVNPYHAVSIEPGRKCCKEALELEDRRFLATAAPPLPLRHCEKSSCTCRYVHYSDRRSNEDRRMQPHNPHGHKMNDRRTEGRRAND